MVYIGEPNRLPQFPTTYNVKAYGYWWTFPCVGRCWTNLTWSSLCWMVNMCERFECGGIGMPETCLCIKMRPAIGCLSRVTLSALRADCYDLKAKGHGRAAASHSTCMYSFEGGIARLVYYMKGTRYIGKSKLGISNNCCCSHEVILH